MKRKTSIMLTLVIALMIFLFYYIHGTPERAIRTAIFGTGDFSRAFSCKIKKLNNNRQTYKVSPPYYEKETGMIFDEYEIEKSRLNYYIAGYHFNN